MSSFSWAIAFIIMVITLGGSAVGCVGIIEHGRNKRELSRQENIRIKQENDWQLESAKVISQQKLDDPSANRFKLSK